MSQQYDYPLPPPPPPTPGGVNAPVITSLAQHHRITPTQPPVIATNLAGALGAPSQTPISATSLSPATALSLTPNSPSVPHSRSSGTLAPPSSARTPVMEPYDPRQWSNRRQVSGSQMVFQHRMSGASGGTRETTGMEATMPSPPPPYSPDSATTNHSRRVRPVSMIEGSGYTASPVQISAPGSSPQGPMSPNFPPPPQSSRFRERSSSGQRAFFNLANLRKSTPNSEIQSTQAGSVAADVEAIPPSSKRASSTGQLQQPQAIEGSSAPALDSSCKSSSSTSWKPGMPLPGPPPGPPPPGTRTQSLNRYSESSSRSNSIGSDRSIEAPAHRRAAATVSSLGPIPPTPAGWVDPDAVSQAFVRPLRIDTGSGHDTSLARRPAKRDSSGHGIRERRSRSRAAKDGADLISPENNESRPEDLVFAPSQGSISRRRDRARVTPGESDRAIASGSQGPVPTSGKATNHVLTPPYTPAVGKPHDEPSKKLAFRASASAMSDRPISQILQQASEDSAVPLSLSPARPPSRSSAKASARLDPFLLQSLERHRAFIEKEASAVSDEERLELFANFMVNESRLRRDRYAGAYNAMAGNIVDLTRDMWRSFGRQSKRPDTPSTSAFPFDTTAPSSASDGRPGTAYGNIPSSASSFEGYTPATDSGSLMEAGESIERSESRQRGEAFKPSLSPIPSMNISTVRDEEGSRGRAPSRWWENSNSGSNSIGKPERIEKSHRETKYMGVNLAELQQTEQDSPRNSWYAGSIAGPSVESFGANEYPPEKVGWHEPSEVETPMPTPGRGRKSSSPGADTLDVSRLVTLPPPYPRHYPALKNKHPLLSDLRSEYRALADHTKIKEIQEAYLTQDLAIQRQQDEAGQERKKQLRAGIQDRIADGTMSYAEAAQAEADFEAEEAGRGKAIARSAFDVFEATLAHPLNALLTERLEKATECISQLRVELESQNEISDPNQAQEEGDEQPERLERLTLLKWLFETREQLHKEMFDLHGDRSAKYSEVILTPFRIAKQQTKIDEANAFFTKDNLDRQTSFASDSLQRFTEFQQIVDSNVTLGVEDQLSAFWDIAPGLLEVIQHIPRDVANLDIRIPDQEYAENPAYNDHPLQYLYSLLSHAQKSAYQFIESQTNLLCLRHEVQTATANSKLRLLETERTQARPADENLKLQMQQDRREQEEGLTSDLKEKVGEVEHQWREALGESLEECKGRVRAYLQDTEGWEEGLDG